MEHTESNWYGSDDPLAVIVGNAPCQPGCGFDGYNIDGAHYECIAAALRADRGKTAAALGLHPVAMGDTDCGWVVDYTVEEAGAWSTARTLLYIGDVDLGIRRASDVRTLHKRVADGHGGYCELCQTPAEYWPCPTIAALDAANTEGV